MDQWFPVVFFIHIPCAPTRCLVFKAKDSDNDTALEAILSLSQEEPEEDALQAGRFWWHVLKSQNNIRMIWCTFSFV